MKKLELKEIIALIAGLVSLASTIAGFVKKDDETFKILFFVTLAACLILIVVIILMVVERLKGAGVKIVNSSKKYFKKLKKLARIMSRRLNRINKKQNEYNLVVRNIRRIFFGCSSETKEKDYNTAAEMLCDEIMSIDRSVLNFEDFRTRIALGRFITKYSKNDEYVIDAYIDSIGYSYIIKNRYKKAERAINEGLIRIEELRKSTKGKDPVKELELTLKELRAYRHLSTTYYTYKFPNKEKSEKNLKKGIDIIEKIDIEHNESLKLCEKLKIDYYMMKFGFDTNSITALISDLKDKDTTNTYKIKEINSALNTIDNDIKILEGLDIHSRKNHRLMKLYVLQMELSRLLIVERGDNSEYYSEKNFKKVQDIINNNIFLDEAFEIYIKEKVLEITEKIKNKLVK